MLFLEKKQAGAQTQNLHPCQNTSARYWHKPTEQTEWIGQWIRTAGSRGRNAYRFHGRYT